MKKVNYGYNESQPQAETINKSGRMSKEQSNELKAIAFQLYLQKITQKSISQMIGVGEKTIGKWAKDWKQAQTIENDTLTNLKKRLLAMTSDHTTPIEEIKSLIYSINQLESNQKRLVCKEKRV